MNRKLIRGAGGGGGGGSSSASSSRAAVISPDSLSSKQIARVLDLVSEGEVEGLVDGHKSIYLDGTPLQNADGSYNFTGFTVETRNGAQTQDYIPGFPATENAYSVSVEVRNGLPVVRQISNPNLDAVRINLAVPQLYYQNPTTGDVSGSAVDLTIEVQDNGGPWQTVVTDTISGKASNRYNRNYRIDLTGVGPWTLRVSKTSPDSDAQTSRDLYWDTITEIVDVKLSYPNSALVGITIDSSQFSNIPSRAYDMKGLRIKVPSNYNPVTRTYTGIWDGTFQIAWSDNPAWCYYDLLTNPRYGLGEFVSEAQVDKANLYTIGRYCDELVPDGFGGQEPRFACNMYLQTREDAFKVLSDMAGLFAGMLYWASGGLSCTQDAPDDPIYQFTNANVIDGSFVYQGSSRNVRHTTALISYNDPFDRYSRKVEYVEDREGILKYGIRQYESVAIGCASRGQAHRLGKRVLLTERYLTETVTFKTGLEGSVPYPGAVIRIMDNNRAGARFGGRVRSGTTGSVTLDAPVTLAAGESYILTIIKTDGTLEERGISNAAGAHQTLNATLPFSEAPNTQAVWVLTSTTLDAQLFKVVAIKEMDGLTYEVTALAYNPDKFAAIEQNLQFEPLNTSLFSSATYQAPPSNVQIDETLYQSSLAAVDAKMTVTWSAPADMQWFDRYRVSWRSGNGNWEFLPDTQNTVVSIAPVMPGPVDVRVVAVNRLGVVSQPATKSSVLLGKTAPPANITGFSVTKINGMAVPVWDSHPDLDVRVGGRIIIRHAQATSGAVWEDSIVLEEFDGNLTTGIVPLQTGTYLAKARDSSGNWSAAAVSFVATEGMVTGFSTVASSVQHPGFIGLRAGLAVVDGSLLLDSVKKISEMTVPVSTWPKLSMLGGIADAGTYDFDQVIDLGSVATRRFEGRIGSSSFDAADTISQRPLVSSWESVSGQTINDCDATLLISTTDDNPAGAPTWGAWTPFLVADATCRAARFRLLLESGSPTHNISINTLRVDAKVPV